MAITPADWDALLAQLQQHTCGCGSSGPLLCTEDCPGDLRDVAMLAALQTVIVALREYEQKERGCNDTAHEASGRGREVYVGLE